MNFNYTNHFWIYRYLFVTYLTYSANHLEIEEGKIKVTGHLRTGRYIYINSTDPIVTQGWYGAFK
ncbi:hypothetical protein [Alkalihalobacterium chitinilyticum]|uniref:Uncharacterized protein n=1 Tax=Alkalihalobacterium chitinilyticum TaxID=2980103 RepID=A0ABT5VGP6_9BACI|nr:hypothetical protein [Alkalihalobacterium chitinilyticum]MDE5413369.1 hypothetical protein [Alkalihalobacterium chitinilyticum]